jgi:HD-like signal output (HDOD) protein/CheY-like chemotaxis protein
MNRILFVDDDPLVLQGLKRMLYPMRKEWEMRFAGGASEALAMMASQPADVVISDMRMPVMNGAQLLNEIMQRHPRAIRIILSGYADTEMTMQCVGGTHQFLSKPCDGETLRASVARALELDRWIGSDSLKNLVTQMKTMPSLPELYFKLVHELNNPDVSLENVGSIISQDAAMTAKILQLVNSAFFGLSRRICDAHDAVVQLGLEMVKALVLAIHVFSEFELRGTAKADMADLQQHSLLTAVNAKQIAELEGQTREVAGAAFTAGLLHDVGRLVLLANFADRWHEVISHSKQHQISISESERAILGVNHAEIGAYLLGLWGLPVALVESAMFHHGPSHCQTKVFTPLTAVHVANVIARHQSLTLAALLARLDSEYLARTGTLERVPVWWKSLCANESQEASPNEKDTLR